jgi:hypothetical protein
MQVERIVRARDLHRHRRCGAPVAGLAHAVCAAMLPISAAFVGTSMATFNRLMIFQNWI